jgi:gentisate 1,2-dioxygenase
LRLVVEGRGAYTTVDGRRLPMDPGDLVLTPAGCWHEHGQEGSEPVIWLDALDVPLVHDLEVSVSEPGERQNAAEALDASETRFRRAGLIPYAEIGSHESYPLLRFPWRDVRAALLALARGLSSEAAVHLAYVNPLTGSECLPTLGCSALLLRPGEERHFPRRSASAAVHAIEGEVDAAVDGSSFRCAERDVLAVPTHARWSMANRSTTLPAFLFMVDDAPLQRKLRIYHQVG